MKTKKIYIIRHGQTDYNLQSIVQGKGIDASLNAHGKSQAQAFYNHYKSEKFDIVYTSTLKRTTESVAAFINEGLKHVKLAGLDEISWGVYEGVEANYEDKLFFKDLTERWTNGETSLAIDEGESPDQVALRQQEVIEILKQSPDEKILICMHGRALRIFLTQLLTIPLAEMDTFAHSNLGLYKLAYNREGFELVDSNNVDHLNELSEVKP